MPKLSTSQNIDNIQIKEQASTPDTPASSYWRLYAKSDGFYAVNSAGVEYGPFSVGGGGASALTTKGDLLTRNASAETRLPAGSDGQLLIADSSVAEGLSWSNYMATGTYTGNGNATQAITGVGFQPRVVWIYPQEDAAWFIKTNQDGTKSKASYQRFEDDHIVSFDSNGFTVGDGTGSAANYMNVSGRNYTFIAWR